MGRKSNFSAFIRIAALLFLLFTTGVAWLMPASAKNQNSFPVYFPLVYYSDPARKGAAVPNDLDLYGSKSSFFTQDLETIRAKWYYNYSDVSPMKATMAAQGIEFVPMSFSGRDMKIDPNYAGYILVFNEPDVAGQANVNQRKAVDRYLALKTKFKNATLVVGGVSVFVENAQWYACKNENGKPVTDSAGNPITSWISCFLNEFERRGISNQEPKYWHAHAYINEGTDETGRLTLAAAKQTLLSLYNKTGGTYWITEYSDVSGSTPGFCEFTRWLNQQAWIARYAPFATRVAGTESWYPLDFWGSPQKVSLIDYSSPAENPTLTTVGQAYTSCTK